jgi:ParB family chromosome partitioning protein
MDKQDSLVVRDLFMSEIFSDPDFNCRGKIAPLDVLELSKSIAEHGLQQPISVQPYNHGKFKWRIVAGHRRHAAFLVLEWPTIPAVIKEHLTDVQVRILNLQENIARKALDIMQESNSLNKFFVANYTIEEVAKMLNQSKGWVQVRKNLLALEPEIQEAAAAGFITQEQIKDLYSLPSKEARLEAAKKAKESRMRGETRAIKIKEKKRNPTTKKVRGKEEIREMIEHILEVLGPNLATRALAWTSAEISDIDLYRDIKEACEEKGVDYEIPTLEPV